MNNDPEGENSIPLKIGRRILLSTMHRMNRWGEAFLTYTSRPKYSYQVAPMAEPEKDLGPMAIVMQGPILEDDNFTLETMRIYEKTMPGVRRYLSTWEDTPEALLAPLRAQGVEIVLSAKPEIPGMSNLNMQLVSAGAGVRRAHEDGADWIMKTRTDQRLYRHNVMGFLASMAHTFPPNGGFDQKFRIFGVGHGTLKYAPYHLGDQTVFGHADDMLTYWTPDLNLSPPPDDWPQTVPEMYASKPLGEMCRIAVAESYIASRFLEKIGRPLDWTIEDNWAVYRDCFGVVDYATTDFFWAKVQTGTLREFINRYDLVWTRNELTFSDWLLLYSGTVTPADGRKYEKALDLRFMEVIEPGSSG